MKPVSSFAVFSAVLLCVRCTFGGIDPKKSIQEIELDEHTVYAIPVSNDRVTTISFPGQIAALDAANVTVDGKQPAFFQLAHKPGSYFFSVRSLVENAATNLNIRLNNKTYVLELHDSRTPWLSVIFQPRA